MRLSELIEALVDLAEDFGDEDPQVLFAYQPDYPLQDEIGSVTVGGDDGDPVAYIVTGGQCHARPYAPAELFRG